ncbi:MucR family transcriptional regulator [Magnetospirillum sp. 15-1]|uniref:MucR family transcriptional regulator n=1 Tax=Magnetospirillum sp. 15-1 TaxID=1979370 RepID=UPI000BBBCC17|nr:MucR family transcriptional regulator [Magnetospirillum sp. 15-1]
MITRTAQIVAAYVGNNTIQVAELPDLIRSTYAALIAIGNPVELPQEGQKPAVSVRKSVTPNALICLECGKSQSMLKRHIMTAHSLSVDDYRSKWSLPADYPMVAPNYAAHRSELAIKIGLGRKPKAAASVEPEAATDTPRHRYPASRWSKPTE